MNMFGHHSEIYICSNCGTLDNFKRAVSGSFVLELFFLIIGIILAISTSWLFLLLPVFYTLWRMSSGKTVCVACKSPNSMPVNSPGGKQLYAKFHPEESATG